jgi:hypothetical protein
MENIAPDIACFDSLPEEITCEIIALVVDFRPIIRLVCVLWNRIMLETINKLHLPLKFYPFIPHNVTAQRIDVFLGADSHPRLVSSSARPDTSVSRESLNAYQTDLGLIPWVWSQLRRGMTNKIEEREHCAELATQWLVRAARYGNLAAMIWCKSRSRVDCAKNCFDGVCARNRALDVAARNNQCEAMKLCRLWGATNLHQALESAATYGCLEALKLCHSWLISIDLDKDVRVLAMTVLERRAVYCLHLLHMANSCFNAATNASKQGFQAIAHLCAGWSDQIVNDLNAIKHTFDGPTVCGLREHVPWCSRLSFGECMHHRADHLRADHL